MIAIPLPSSFPIVIATSSAAGIIHRPSCGPLVALSHILKSAKLNWFHLAGEVPATPAARGIDFYNKETVSSREAIPYEVTQREWEASRAELLDLIHEMTEEQLHAHFVMPWGTQGTIETLVEIFTEHEETHAKEIRDIIEKEQLTSKNESPS